MTNDEQQHENAPTPEELRDVIPHLQGEPDEDEVLDAQEAAAEGAGQTDENDEDEYIDADDLLELLGELKEMLEAQAKEIRGLRREMRELREAGGAAPASRKRAACWCAASASPTRSTAGATRCSARPRT